MAKTRAQRKAERRRRQAQQGGRGGDGASRAQHRTQVPESADVVEAELAEQGADLIELAQERPGDVEAEAAEAPPAPAAEEPPAPAPSRADVGTPAGVAEAEPAVKISRRARRQAERDRKQRAKESE